MSASIGPHGRPDREQQAFLDLIRERHRHETGHWPADVDMSTETAYLEGIRRDDETIDAVIAGSDMDPYERDRILHSLVGKPVHGCVSADDADVTLRALLGGYRNAIHARKMPPLNIDAGRLAHLRARHRRHRIIRAVTWTLYTLIITIALALCVLTLASATATPGDWLWPLHQLVYTVTS